MKLFFELPEGKEMIEASIDTDSRSSDFYQARIDGRTLSVKLYPFSEQGWLLLERNKVSPLYMIKNKDQILVWFEGKVYPLKLKPEKKEKKPFFHSGEITAPMPGRIIKVLVNSGDSVSAEKPLLVLESMKMEMTISAPFSGDVKTIFCQPGEMVEMGKLLMELQS